MEYRDFVIRARDWQGEELRVDVSASPVGRLRGSEPAPLSAEVARSVLGDLERLELPRARLVELGWRLAEALLPPAVREMLVRSLDSLGPDQGLRLRLLCDEPGLAELPWEYLHLDRAGGEAGLDGFLALDPRISIVREEPIPLPAPPLAKAGRLRVVVGFAAPEDEEPLDLAVERQSIATALQGLDRFDVTYREHLTPDDLGPALQEGGVFHFAGHGARVMGGEGFLVLEDAQRRAAGFPAETLGLLLRAAGVRLVVLNACQTGRRSGARVWAGVAAVLTKVGIPAVVAMQASVHDDSATRFSRGLYRATAAGLSLDEAVTAGRLDMLGLALPDDLDWGLPVLYLRSPDGVLFAPEDDAAPERERIRVEVRQRVAHLRSALTGVAAEEVEAGEVHVAQEIGTLDEGGSVTGVKIGRLGIGGARRPLIP